MAHQYDFYDGQPPHQKHSQTSRTAAAAIIPTATTKRMKVLRFIREHGGATDEEIQKGIPMPASTERPRRRELQLQGMVMDSGKTRPTESGRSAVVWVCSENLDTTGNAKCAPHNT